MKWRERQKQGGQQGEDGDHDMSLASSMSFDLFSFCSLYFFLNYKKTACTERRSI